MPLDIVIIISFLYVSHDEIILTHGGLVTPYGDMELGQHWLM